jgi:hypothetical protein
MGKKAVLAKKRRGPPPTGKGTQIVVRMQPAPLTALDAWVVTQSDSPTRAEAIRRLVELGLTVKTRGRSTNNDQKLRAREIAGKAIDRMTDTTASVEVQVTRKKRLLKGPEEFQAIRVDQP